MSRCMAIHTADDIYVELGPEAPRVYRGYDYGSYIVGVWNELAALGRRLGLGDLATFVCPEDAYLESEELREEIDEAQEEGDERHAERLRETLVGLLPSHDPRVALEVVRGLIAHLEREPESDLANASLTDLRAYKIALSRCAADGRRVFITPY